MDTFEHLRYNLKRLRKSQDLTQEHLAELAGLDYKHYQKIEGGSWPGLQLRTIDQLANALNVSPYELFLPENADLSKRPKIQFRISVDMLNGLTTFEAPKEMEINAKSTL